MPATHTSSANRGKKAEKTVHKILDTFNSRCAGFTFNRVPDAHAAGGRFPAQAGDFQAFKKTPMASRNFIIEVKEVKHDYRLPHGNYSEDKVSRVQKRVWAGTEAVVAVLHTTTNQWRLVPFEVFTTRPGGSWNLAEHPLVNIELALSEFLGVM